MPVSSILTVYIYAYPFFHGCGFPAPDGAPSTLIWKKLWDPKPNAGAPFRLLALGDPQLEGDTSLPDPDASYFPSITSLRSNISVAETLAERAVVISDSFERLIASDVPTVIQAWRKKLDLLGNDYYLAHIYRTMQYFTEPTHISVLGDLLGSQWIEDDEFEYRGWRFWQRVFKFGRRVEDEVTRDSRIEDLGQDTTWNRRIINIAGNHDVGYAGDMTPERIERFERVFGRSNREIRFRLPSNDTNEHGWTRTDDQGPELRIVVLNSLNLDTPALNQELQSKTYSFINEVIGQSRPVEDRKTGTIVLTHVPLHKEEGTCVDAPFFDFYENSNGGGIKEQNHLSYHAGKGILEGILGMSGNPSAPGNGLGRNGIILTGHDHEGCDVYHYIPPVEDDAEPQWQAAKWSDAVQTFNRSRPGVREVTVRSMMGDFGGNAGLLSAWFDHEVREWRFAYSSCSIGVQHIWWAIHILDLITIGLLVFALSSAALDTQALIVGLKKRTAGVSRVPKDSSKLEIPRRALGQDQRSGNRGKQQAYNRPRKRIA